MPGSQASSARRWTIPITCFLDGRAHDVTDENVVVAAITGPGGCGGCCTPAAVLASAPGGWRDPGPR